MVCICFRRSASDRITLSPARSWQHGEESLLSAWCIASPKDADCTSTHMNPTMYGTRLRHPFSPTMPHESHKCASTSALSWTVEQACTGPPGYGHISFTGRTVLPRVTDRHFLLRHAQYSLTCQALMPPSFLRSQGLVPPILVCLSGLTVQDCLIHTHTEWGPWRQSQKPFA